jgi:cysteine sulfinate desulfinase/cysteine desulfurase-like protein
MIYLDNSATSWPKPVIVKEAMVAYFDEVGGNPDRYDDRFILRCFIVR